mgnify:CR=1 FL=1
MKKIKIVVVGLGYVGLSNALLLAQKNSVTAVDIDIDKVNLINKRKSPLADQEMDSFLSNKTLDLKVKYNKEFQKVISNKQISALYHAEEEFKKDE